MQSRSQRSGLIAALLVVGGLIVSPSSAQADGPPPQSPALAAGAGKPGTATGGNSGLEPELELLLSPRVGVELQRARMPWWQALDLLPSPAFGRDRSTAPAASNPGDSNGDDVRDGDGDDPLDQRRPGVESEPPLPAQQAYLEARIAMREGNLFLAVDRLRFAMRLAPRSALLAYRLAELLLASGARTQGRAVLEQGLTLDPYHPAMLLMLGQVELEQGQWDRAAGLLARRLELAGALHGDDANAAARGVKRGQLDDALALYLLAASLRQGGHDLAAIQGWTRFLEVTKHHLPISPPQAGELSDRERVWLQIGDAWHRLGDPEKALAAYQQAHRPAGLSEGAGAGDAPDHAVAITPAAVLQRRAFTLLKLDRAPDAIEAVVAQLDRIDDPKLAVDLIAFLTRQGIDPGALLDAITAYYGRIGRPERLARSIAEVLGGEAGLSFALEHLRDQPGDLGMLGYVLETALRSGPAPRPGSSSPRPGAIFPPAMAISTDQAHRAAQAIELAGQTARHNPRAVQQVADALIHATGLPPEDAVHWLEAGAARLADDEGQNPAVNRLRDVMRARWLARAGWTDHARVLLDDLLADPSLTNELEQATRIELARLLLANDAPAQAADALIPMPDDDLDVALLRIQARAEAGESELAIALTRRWRAIHPDHIELLLAQARLLAAEGPTAVQAERLLLDALNDHPRDARLYQALVTFYDTVESADFQGNRVERYNQLMRRMLSAAPESRVARIAMADFLIAQGDRREAATILRSLLDEQPDEPGVLSRYLTLLAHTQREEEGHQYLRKLIESDPRNRALHLEAARYYTGPGVTRNQQQADHHYEQHLLLSPPSTERDTALARLYRSQDRHQRALDVLRLAMERRLPDPAPVLTLTLLSLAALQQEDALQEATDRAVQAYPAREADLLHALASVWEFMGQTDRSRDMMRSILERHPDHPETNNSLGYLWADGDVNLEEARAMIQKAVDAEPRNAAFLDSLGWVLYKLGDFEQAVAWLQRARDLSGPQPDPVILDHLGDAAYRAGDHREALSSWRQARAQLLRRETGASRAAEGSLRERIENKLRQAQRGQSVDVTASPGAPDAPAPEAEEQAPADPREAR